MGEMNTLPATVGGKDDQPPACKRGGKWQRTSQKRQGAKRKQKGEKREFRAKGLNKAQGPARRSVGG